jgi:hypothetical protein
MLTVLIYFILLVALAASMLGLLSHALKAAFPSAPGAAAAAASYSSKAQIAAYHRSVYQATGECPVTYFNRLEAEARQHGVKYSNYYEDIAVLSNVPGGWAANHLSDRDRAVLDQHKIY